jgi:hypothetical protein
MIKTMSWHNLKGCFVIAKQNTLGSRTISMKVNHCNLWWRHSRSLAEVTFMFQSKMHKFYMLQLVKQGNILPLPCCSSVVPSLNALPVHVSGINFIRESRLSFIPSLKRSYGRIQLISSSRWNKRPCLGNIDVCVHSTWGTSWSGMSSLMPIQREWI